MERRHEFFAWAAKANLTGEQARVLMRLLACEYDGVMGVKQNEIAQELGLTESNVSRAIKALMDVGLISKDVSKGFDGRPVLQIDQRFLTMDKPEPEPMNSCRCCSRNFPYREIQFALIDMNGQGVRELVCDRCKEKYGIKRRRSTGGGGGRSYTGRDRTRGR